MAVYKFNILTINLSLLERLKNKNKIAVVISLDKHLGGITTMVKNSSIALSKIFSEVIILVPRSSIAHSYIKEIFKVYSNVRIEYISYIDRFLIRHNLHMSKRVSFFMNNSDIIFVHNLSVIKSISKRIVKPVIFAYNHTDKIKYLDQLNLADKVLSVNKTFANIINKFLKETDKAVVLGNCLDLNKPKTYRYSENKLFTVGTLGRLVNKKGFDLLISACLNSKDIKLMIGGDGPERTSLEKMANKSNNIEFLGWINNLDELFNNIDIFVLPSKIEPFGIVLIEAMSRGIPVISTNCNGPRDIINHRVNGILLKNFDSKEMLEAIYYLKNNKNFRCNLGKEAIKTIKSKYVVKRYTSQLREIISNFWINYKETNK